ncbi:MAG: FAD-binding protein [Saprospiraceae bacterium]|nr:FAD-binding protein [Saprospiraceae bacterium]
MIYDLEISIDPSEINNEELIVQSLCRKAGISTDDLAGYHLRRRSIDSRKMPVFKLRYQVYTSAEDYERPIKDQPRYLNVENSEEVFIVGAGPAGYFAALRCLEHGLKPIVLDRGKDAKSRRRDLRAIQQEGIVNPDSNYCFGEGGAGTYSDGKLYTRSKKRGSVDSVLRILVDHGADPDILVEAHPHIGSNKLPKIIANIRGTIEAHGGQVLFGQKVIDLDIQGHHLKGLITQTDTFPCKKAILATGHSARDIYNLLYRKGISIEGKPFALGVRVEHPQTFIDQKQYGMAIRHPNLPAASYRLACEIHGRGVFSFCMCPGGLIVPAATAPGEIVVNGMSLSRRDSPFANAGIVVAVSPQDAGLHGFSGPLGSMLFQSQIEKSMFESGDGSQKAPAQRVRDFLRGTKSSSLGPTSYIPGIHSQSLDQLLPSQISQNLKKGFTIFERKMPGFTGKEAIVVGVESRTSAPVRIPRHTETCLHPDVMGLYPCGEGAGYAGGIVSAAIDGQKVATAIAELKLKSA